MVSAPALPRVYVPPDAEHLRQMCSTVERTAVSTGGVSPDYARGFTRQLQAVVGPGVSISPSAIYYFIVREWNLGHDYATATNALAVGQRNGEILRLKDLPTLEPGH
jgi:hypothetical protein